MANTLVLSRNFDQGFVSDIARDELGKSAAFRMRDYIPQLEAPLRKRGGWAYGSPDYGSLGGAGYMVSLGWLPFPGDGHLVSTGNTGAVFQQKRFDGLGGAVVSSTGSALVPTQGIFWHRDRGIILQGLNQGAATPNKYIDSGGGVYTVAPIGGTPPQARMGFSWGDYLVLGNYYDPSAGGVLKNNRWAWSAVGNPDLWTLSGASGSTWDFPEEIVAGLPVRNVILAWGYDNLHIMTGDTPPPGGNLARKMLFAGQGTFDGRTVVSWRDYAIWANSSGVFQTDGATFTDLTYEGGILTYYRQVVAGFAFSQGWSAAGGIYRDHYVLTIRNAAGTVLTTLACDLARKVWSEWVNVPAFMFAHHAAGPGTALFGGDEELFFAHKGSPRIGRISTLWTPSATYASDADGTAVLPSLETPYYTMENDALKRIRNIYVKYDVRTSGGSPLLRVYATIDPVVGAAYTQVTPDLTTTTQMQRKAVGIRKLGLGVGLRVDQVGASADTRIFGFEAEGHPREGSH